MSTQLVSHTAWSRALRRAINATLAMVMLVQPGCMCGCSAPTTAASFACGFSDIECSSLNCRKHCNEAREMSETSPGAMVGFGRAKTGIFVKRIRRR